MKRIKKFLVLATVCTMLLGSTLSAFALPPCTSSAGHSGGLQYYDRNGWGGYCIHCTACRAHLGGTDISCYM